MAPQRRRRERPDAGAVGLPRPRQPGRDLLVPARRPGTDGTGRRPPGSGSAAVTALAPTLQAFFTDRLIGQRGASPHTIAGYRDTWRMLLAFASQRTGKNPCQL